MLPQAPIGLGTSRGPARSAVPWPRVGVRQRLACQLLAFCYRLFVAGLGLSLVLATSCGGPVKSTGGEGGGAGAGEGQAGRTSDLVLASTTSTQDSGLFDVLIPAFNRAFPQYLVKVVAVGSGEALKLGETGDADVLLVHSPQAEETFMADGFGADRRQVMYNDFVIVGPQSDPAGIKGLTDASAALAKIAEEHALFFTRNDASGTHAKEQALWEKAGLSPRGEWYQSTGQGMGETLTIADQKNGYALSDRATFLAKRKALNRLAILVEGDARLRNYYHVIAVKQARNPQGARDFLTWIVSPTVQQDLIGTFGVEKYGEPLFVPAAG